MAYMIQQHPQQISTESLACQKKNRLLKTFSDVKHPLFLPSFCIPLNDSTKSTVETVSDITTIILDGVAEAAIMYGGVDKLYQDTYHTHLWCEVRRHPSS